MLTMLTIRRSVSCTPHPYLLQHAPSAPMLHGTQHCQTAAGSELLHAILPLPAGFMAHSDAKRDDRRAKERYTV